MTYRHEPVMVQEVIRLLRPEAGKRYLDGTLGGGGHAGQILERSSPDGKVLGLDRDDMALAAAREKLGCFGERLVTRQANFTEAKTMLEEIQWSQVDGILLDLGISSHHIEEPERGFSFRAEARLDMRMDRRQSLDAYQVINNSSPSELERIFREYGEEPRARRIALAIDKARQKRPVATTQELAAIVTRTIGKYPGKIHPATRVFQALRIAVNRELENLEVFLQNAYELLFPRGRMVSISYHSLEDRLVKNSFRKWSKSCLCPPRTLLCRCGWSQKVRLLTSKPVVPSREEIQRNPRARSAKLRAVERI